MANKLFLTSICTLVNRIVHYTLFQIVRQSKNLVSLDYSRTDMRGAAGEAVEIYREPVATKQIGSPLG